MHYSHPLFTHLPYLALGHARATDKRLRALLLLLLSDPVEDRCRLLLLLAHLGVNREGLGWTTSAVTSNGIIISWGRAGSHLAILGCAGLVFSTLVGLRQGGLHQPKPTPWAAGLLIESVGADRRVTAQRLLRTLEGPRQARARVRVVLQWP